jgi:hypothetical protein
VEVIVMPTTAAKPDLIAHQAAIRADVAVIVQELRGALGARLVAVIAGVVETRAVHQWADGTRELKSSATEDRLRLAYHLWKLITQRDSDRVAQAWFTGLNPKLDDASPARLLRDGDLEEEGPRLLAAARAFATTGS